MSLRLLSTHPNTSEDIFTDNKYVFKVSKCGISRKILAERDYYEYVFSDLKRFSRFFPKYFGYEVFSGKNSIKLEFLKNYEVLSRLLLNKKVSVESFKKIIQNIIGALVAFKDSDQGGEEEVLFNELYIKRVFDRISDMDDAIKANLGSGE